MMRFGRAIETQRFFSVILSGGRLCVTRSGETSEVGHRATADEKTRRVRVEADDLLDPINR